MSQPAREIPFDRDAYLNWEEQQPEKHAFYQGEVFAMVGARREHVVVSGNLYAALKQRLRGGPCQAYIADMKLHVSAMDAFFYPDVMVSCDPRDHAADRYLEHPMLLIEVLSESTAAFDRGDKFAAYRTVPELQEYVLVDVSSRRIESFRRASGSEWLFHDYRPEQGDCRFSSLELALPFDEIFEDLDATASSEQET